MENASFMMDFENECLRRNWDNSVKPYPRGPERYADLEWANMIKLQIQHNDVDWEKYVAWVKAGGGDEWFQPEEE